MSDLPDKKVLRKNNDNAAFRNLLCAALFGDDVEFQTVALAHLKKEYFENDAERFFLNSFVSYAEQYKKFPNLKTVEILASQAALSEGAHKAVCDLYEEIAAVDHSSFDSRWLIDEMEIWCRYRAIHNAVVEAIKVLENDDSAADVSNLPTILSDAVSVSFNDAEGADYFKDAEKRYEEYHRRDYKISTGMEHFDYIFKGGLAAQSLMIAMAPTGVGKSILMCSWAAAQLLLNYKVLYISMELSETMISKRIDQNLLGVSEEELMLLPKSTFLSKVSTCNAKTSGQLVIKTYGAGSANVNHFRKLLKNLETRKGFIPDIIFIDYLSICGSARSGKNANSYERVKNVSEELRAMATEECYGKTRVVTAMQVNRSGFSAELIDLTHTSDSIGITFTADAIVALQSSDVMRQAGRMKVIQLKNRWGDTYDRHAYEIGIDYPHMRLYDLEAQPEYIQSENRNKEQEALSIDPEKRTLNITGMQMFKNSLPDDDSAFGTSWDIGD